MSDLDSAARDFDSRLSRLFAQAPSFSDNDAFAALVTARLDRAWAMRRIMITAGGLAAGVVAAWQFVAGQINGELTIASQDARQAVDGGVDRLFGAFDQLASLPMAGGETLWLGAGLAALALAFAVTRAIEAF